MAWTARAAGGDAGFDVWQDEHWALGIPAEPSGLPVIAVLISRAHHDLEDLPAELAAELGPMIQRVARAVGSLEDVGRVHVNRWGDGGEHFHVWFLGRPKGMWQLRGALLAVWDDLLPKVPQEEWDRNRRAVADGHGVRRRRDAGGRLARRALALVALARRLDPPFGELADAVVIPEAQQPDVGVRLRP